MTMPIIRLEVQGMKHAIMTALTKYSAQMDADIQTAIDMYCTPENIAHVVHTTATDALDSAIKEEVNRFFQYGQGRIAVAEAVKETLLSKHTYTKLDDVDVKDNA